MLEITSSHTKRVVLILTCVLFFSPTIFAKNQFGDSFGASYGSAFPQRDFTIDLNSLQVLANPLFGEPFSTAESSWPLKIPFSEISHSEDFRRILAVFPNYGPGENNIFNLDASILKSGRSRTKVWSYNSLPVFKGGVAQRFQNPVFQTGNDWRVLYQEYLNNPAQTLINNGLANLLSPIEKYEYLTGQSDFSLTKSQWTDGKNYFDIYGEVPKWIGYCHGTAPSVLKHPRPARAVKLKSFDGANYVTFYPSDIKQLLAYSWGTSSTASAIVGRRCRTILHSNARPGSNCLDVNPASFFLATLNLLGANQQSFIIDSSAGNEVWNRSIVAYRYSYFNPSSKLITDNLRHALLERKDYINDPYIAYRASESTSIIGIWMEVSYIAASKSSAAETDSETADEYGKLSYRFDLEVDDNGTIIGGEWHNNIHPDFLWVVADNHFPSTIFDTVTEPMLMNYSGTAPLNIEISNQAKFAAQNGKVLHSLLQAMLRLSQ